MLEERDTECSSWETNNRNKAGYEVVVVVIYSGKEKYIFHQHKSFRQRRPSRRPSLFPELFIVPVTPLYEVLLFWDLGELDMLLKPCWFSGRQFLFYYTSGLLCFPGERMSEGKLFRIASISYFLTLSLIARQILLILHPQCFFHLNVTSISTLICYTSVSLSLSFLN